MATLAGHWKTRPRRKVKAILFAALTGVAPASAGNVLGLFRAEEPQPTPLQHLPWLLGTGTCMYLAYLMGYINGSAEREIPVVPDLLPAAGSTVAAGGPDAHAGAGVRAGVPPGRAFLGSHNRHFEVIQAQGERLLGQPVPSLRAISPGLAELPPNVWRLGCPGLVYSFIQDGEAQTRYLDLGQLNVLLGEQRQFLRGRLEQAERQLARDEARAASEQDPPRKSGDYAISARILDRDVAAAVVELYRVALAALSTPEQIAEPEQVAALDNALRGLPEPFQTMREEETQNELGAAICRIELSVARHNLDRLAARKECLSEAERQHQAKLEEAVRMFKAELAAGRERLERLNRARADVRAVLGALRGDDRQRQCTVPEFHQPKPFPDEETRG
jgi:hypothetical protein